MDELISRQAAVDALKKAYWDKDIQSAKNDPCIVDAMTDWAIRQVKALPSAQPEIILCKDCKYHNLTNCPIEKYFSLDGFCSRAERREAKT